VRRTAGSRGACGRSLSMDHYCVDARRRAFRGCRGRVGQRRSDRRNCVRRELALYEPVLVSVTGSSIGHYLSNLRVVDDRTRGNVGFLKAIARLGIKTLLGVYSFLTMAVTSHHQAVHDLLTDRPSRFAIRPKQASLTTLPKGQNSRLRPKRRVHDISW